MTWLVTTGLTNAVLAALLAGLAYGVGRWAKRPALTHVLWVLVLVKLLTPPVFQVPIGWRIDPAVFGATPVVAAAAPPVLISDNPSALPVTITFPPQLSGTKISKTERSKQIDVDASTPDNSSSEKVSFAQCISTLAL